MHACVRGAMDGAGASTTRLLFVLHLVFARDLLRCCGCALANEYTRVIDWTGTIGTSPLRAHTQVSARAALPDARGGAGVQLVHLRRRVFPRAAAGGGNRLCLVRESVAFTQPGCSFRSLFGLPPAAARLFRETQTRGCRELRAVCPAAAPFSSSWFSSSSSSSSSS